MDKQHISYSNDFKKIKIVKPLSFENKIIEIPLWVGQACIGLTFFAIKIDKDFSVLPDTLIEFLKNQNPQSKSIEAANWIDDNVFWSGGMPIKAEEVEIYD